MFNFIKGISFWEWMILIAITIQSVYIIYKWG
jgi:hypothetical protein